MPLAIPPELKKMTPYVRRAEELDRDRNNPESRLVAYYSRQYAVSVGIPLASSSEGKQCLGNILGDLEAEKGPMSNFTRDEAKFLCRKFADGIFNKADGEDRMGMATKNTAKTFYAAATFYEILQQFYEGDEESEELEEEKKRAIFSKWKSTEILKAMKEGRKPTPGGYGENLEEDGEEEEEEKEEEEERTEKERMTETSEETDLLPPPVPPSLVVLDVAEEDNDEQSDQGNEVGLLGPPPSFPGDSAAPDEVFAPNDSPSPASTDRPPVKPTLQPPIVSAPVKSSGLFGTGKKKTQKAKVSKGALKDAVELTKFALSALQNKDVEVGATRLKEALAALGR